MLDSLVSGSEQAADPCLNQSTSLLYAVVGNAPGSLEVVEWSENVVGKRPVDLA